MAGRVKDERTIGITIGARVFLISWSVVPVVAIVDLL